MEFQNNQETINKMALVSLHLSIIAINGNEFNYLIKSSWMDKKRKLNYMLPTVDSLQI